MTTNPFGDLSIKIPSGSVVGKGDPPKNCYVTVVVEDNATEPATMRSEKCDDLQFRMSKDVACTTTIQRGMNCLVHVWQWALIGTDKQLGSAKVPLDNLDTGGAVGPEDYEIKDSKGTPILKVNVSISWKDGNVPESASAAGAAATAGLTKPLGGKPGDKVLPLPDPENQNYGVRVKIHRLKGLQNIDPEKCYNPRCIIQASSKTYKTEVQKRTNDPTFDEEANLQFEKVSKTFFTELLCINVVSDRFGLPDEKIGLVQLDLGSIYRCNRTHTLLRKWFVILRAAGDGTVMGYCKASLSVMNLRTDNLVEFDDEGDNEDEKDEDITQNLVNVTGAAFEEIFLHCDVVKGEGMPKMDAGPSGKCDPYVKILFGKASVETCHCNTTYTPRWETRLCLPVMLPCLASTLRVELWDYDTALSDDMIGTYLLDLLELMAGRKDNLPLLATRYINFYGHPRSKDANWNKYFKQMVRGQKRGIDYRGRILMRIQGSRSKILPAMPSYRDTRIDVDVLVEVMQISQLPSKDKFKIKAFCGTTSAATQLHESTKMTGEGVEGYALYMGEKVQFTASINVVVPTRDEILSSQIAERDTFDDRDANVVQSFAVLNNDAEVVAAMEKVIWEQIPALVVHLITDSNVNALLDKVTGAIDEEPTAAVVFPTSRFLASGGSFTISKAMRLMGDPEQNKSGKQPGNPLLQVNCGMRIINIQPPPEFPVPVSTVPHKLVAGAGRMRSLILSVFVYHARNVPAGDDSGLSDPYVTVSWANAGMHTGTKKETLNPTWNEALYVEVMVKDPLPDVVIELWDWDWIGSDTFLCKAYLNLANVKNNKPFWITTFTNSFGKHEENTQLLVAVSLEPATDERRAALGHLRKVPMRMHRDSTRTYKGYPIPTTHALSMAQYSFSCHLFGLRAMRKFHLKDVSSPQIEFECYDNVTASARKSGKNADFDQELSWILTLPSNEEFLPYLNVYVYDYRLGLRVLVAVAQVSLTDPMLRLEVKKAKQRDDDERVRVHLSEIMMYEKKAAEKELDSSAATSSVANSGTAEQDSQKPPVSFGTMVTAVSAFTAGAATGSPTQPAPGAAAAAGAPAAAPAAGAAPAAAAPGAATTNNNEPTNPQAGVEMKPVPAAAGSPIAPAAPTPAKVSFSAAALKVAAAQQQKQQATAAVAPSPAPRPVVPAAVAGVAGGAGPLDNRNLDPESILSPTVIASQSLDNKIRSAVEETNKELDDPSETQSTVSTEPDELPWYDRFDPASAALGDGELACVPYERRVARLGKVCAKARSLGAGKSNAEDAFGPFDDQYTAIPLYRGWGSSGSKAGQLNADLLFQKLGDNASPLAEPAASPAGSPAGSPPAAAAAAGAGALAAGATRAAQVRWKPSDARKKTPFLCRVYIVACKELTAMDSGIFGNASDPYVVLTMSSGGSSSSKDVIVNCKDQIRYQVLDPEYYFVRELSGELPIHTNLRVTVLDYDRFGSDEVIGFTDINLEERYYSQRGYKVPRVNARYDAPPEGQDPAGYYGLNHYGSYTEKRMLRTETGLAAGNIELWVDVFDFSQPVPRPIDIAPPPPIPMELRVVVWNVRDCELTDEAITGELMTDIYVRCWVDSMDSNVQNTDVHYRSLDGTGNFNWRMVYPLVFDPRLKKIFPVGDIMEHGAPSESGGAASTATKKFFGVRKEAKKLKPRLKVQLWDNDLFPGTDDFIGETNLNLLNLIPAFSRRKKSTLLGDFTNDCKHCSQQLPWRCCCFCDCCKPDKAVDDMTLKERQDYAHKEMREERMSRDAQLLGEVKIKFEALKDKFPPEEHDKVMARLLKQAKKATKINVFMKP